MLAPYWKEKLVIAQGDALKVFECSVGIEKSIQHEDLVSGVSFELCDLIGVKWTDIEAWLGHCLNCPPSIYRPPDRVVMLETFLDIISSQSQENIQDHLDCYELFLVCYARKCILTLSYSSKNQRQKNIMFTRNETNFDSDLTEYDYGESEGDDIIYGDSGEEECPSEEESKRQKTDGMNKQEGRVNKEGELFQRYYALASSWKEKLGILEVGFCSLHSILSQCCSVGHAIKLSQRCNL